MGGEGTSRKDPPILSPTRPLTHDQPHSLDVCLTGLHARPPFLSIHLPVFLLHLPPWTPPSTHGPFLFLPPAPPPIYNLFVVSSFDYYCIYLFPGCFFFFLFVSSSTFNLRLFFSFFLLFFRFNHHRFPLFCSFFNLQHLYLYHPPPLPIAPFPFTSSHPNHPSPLTPFNHLATKPIPPPLPYPTTTASTHHLTTPRATGYECFQFGE